MANTCTDCDGSGYYGSWGNPKHCLSCAKGRANFLRVHERQSRLTIDEQAAIELARAEAAISVDTVPLND